MLIIIAPNFFTATSNGHLACIKVCKSLISCLGESDVRVVSGEESPGATQYYRHILRNAYLTETQMQFDDKLNSGEPYCLLLPDDIEGTRSSVVEELRNSQLCKRVYIIAYAPLFVFAQSKQLSPFAQFDDRYRIIFFSDWIMPPMARNAGGIHVYQEPEEMPDVQEAAGALLAHSKPQQKANIAIYAGKGIYRLSNPGKRAFSEILSSVTGSKGKVELITRSTPESKSLLYSLLAECNLLICLDPFSNLEREALLLGCLVWKPNPGQAGRIPGIFYGDLSKEELRLMLNMIFSDKRKLIETYRQYSLILRNSSAVRLQLMMRAIAVDMQAAFGTSEEAPVSNEIVRRILHKVTEELKSATLNVTSAYKGCIHPMRLIPDLNNSLKLESAINLMLGNPSSEDEVRYDAAVDSA